MRASTLTRTAITVLFLNPHISPSAARPIGKKRGMFDKNGTTDKDGNLEVDFSHFGRAFCHRGGMGCFKKRDVVPISEDTSPASAAPVRKILIATNEGVVKRDTIDISELLVAGHSMK